MTKTQLEQQNKEAYQLLKECRSEILQNREDLEEAEAIMGVLKDLRWKNNELLNIYRDLWLDTLNKGE